MSLKKTTRSAKPEGGNQNSIKVQRRKPFDEKHIIGFLFATCFLVTLFLGVLLTALVALKIPDIRTVSHYKPLQTSYILDRRGRVVERIYTENRDVVPLSSMPVLLPKAFVAAEDGRFYGHPGLDFFSVIRAVFINLKRGGKAQGASTITQQVARSLLLTREKTYLRKFKEAILAWRIDTLLSKEDIIYIYLNQIYLGEGAYGVEAAAQVYFDKHVGELSLGEMAVLAGLPQAPSRYSPYHNREAALSRQRYVLNRMAADGYISKENALRAFEAGLHFAKKEPVNLVDSGYYNAIVKKRVRKVITAPLERAGVRIYTHLDLDQQRAAVQAVRNGVMAAFGRQATLGMEKNKVPQGALVSIDGCTANVRALVGGADYSLSHYDRAAIARRQAGSAFKPIIYSVALLNGWQSQSMILDAPLSISAGAGKRWNPKNYTGRYYGETTLAEALAHSYNTAAVRLLQKVGLRQVYKLSEALGITSEMPDDLSLALGSVEVSLLELTAAYTPFICSGRYTAPRFIDRIEKPDGSVIINDRYTSRNVMTGNVASQMKGMLQLVITEGTGIRAQGVPGVSGGKTGTSDESKDAWFIGFNNSTMTGVWVGHDHNEPLGKGENGGRTAAPIWRDFMLKTEGQR